MEENRVLSETERNWAMICHLSAFAGFFFPFGGIIGPLICWLSKKDESAWVDIVLAVPLFFIIIGIPIVMILITLKVICIIIASVKAAKGELFRYPLVIPFIQ
jgi:uncharacterized Tic20 family protein